jgi:hypothetical protein
VELLEARNLPSGGVNPLDQVVIEDFENPNSLAGYTTVLRFQAAADLSSDAAHDGGLGLVKHDGYEWMVRNDLAAQISAGDTISVWVQFKDNADGRAYFGFGATPNGPTSPLWTGGTLSLVLAPNTDQLLLEDNSGFAHQTLAAADQIFQPDQWYRAEVNWGADGDIIGNLYDSDGTTLLNSVEAFDNSISSGGFAFRAFGSDKYFDTVTVDSGSAAARRARSVHATSPGSVGQSLPPPPSPPRSQRSDVLLPFDYQSVPGTGLDVALLGFDQLQQAGPLVGTRAGFAASSYSYNNGTVQIGWGPIVSSLDVSGIPLETPGLEQFIFRQRPGEPTTLIGSSDIKHFATTNDPDHQHLQPGEGDLYGSVSNMYQPYYHPAAELDPVTGALASLDYYGPRDVDGINHYAPQQYTDQIEHLLQVEVSDLDPSQNPEGTRWYLAGNLWLPGDEDVTNNSRWVEIVPQFDGSRFMFTYPNGSTGEANIRTMPGLGAGPAVISQDPVSTAEGPISSLRVTFNRAINPATFTPSQVASFTGPAGPIAVTDVSPVAGSDDTQFEITFDPQGLTGIYTMILGPDIQDTDGNPMDQNEDGIAGGADDQYAARFAIQGPKIVSFTPSQSLTAYPVDHVEVTFNKPINPDTFTPDKIASFSGPTGAIAITNVTVVPDSNDQTFDIWFDPQSDIGNYVMVIGPDIEDYAGNTMDQNGDYVPGEGAQDEFQLTLTILDSTLGPDGFGYTATVHPFDGQDIVDQPGTFTILESGDQVSVPVDLGANTVNFYGTTYSGDNQLFVSPKGLITFGHGDSSFLNSDLTSSPPEPAIAVLWNDWINSSASPMIVGQFDDFDGNGVPHRLIIEWNQVRHYGYYNTVTFQASLSLNDGDNPSNIVVNYLNLQSNDYWAEGHDATVGIKDQGTQGDNRLLVNIADSPFVGTGEALQFAVDSGSHGRFRYLANSEAVPVSLHAAEGSPTPTQEMPTPACCVIPSQLDEFFIPSKAPDAPFPFVLLSEERSGQGTALSDPLEIGRQEVIL